jgi:hypothetical protein
MPVCALLRSQSFFIDCAFIGSARQNPVTQCKAYRTRALYMYPLTVSRLQSMPHLLLLASNLNLEVFVMFTYVLFQIDCDQILDSH